MLHLFREMRVLREEGKLHRRILIRTRLLLVISAILLAIVLYNIFTQGTNAFFALAIAIVGFIFGALVFSRMGGKLQWNEEEEVVESGRMDIIGYASIALYIAFEIGLRTALHDVFPVSATALLLAAIFGVLFGRVVGTMTQIHRVYAASHTN